MKQMLFVLLIGLFSPWVCAEVYTWVDSRGVVHFSDEPSPGGKSEPIALPEAQTFTNTTPTPTSDEEKQKLPEYKSLTILDPADQMTLRDNQSRVNVVLSLDPGLKKGDLLQVLIDGKLSGPPQDGMQFQLTDVYSGTHVIEGQLINDSGQVILSSKPVTIYMHRPRINMAPKRAS